MLRRLASDGHQARCCSSAVEVVCPIFRRLQFSPPSAVPLFIQLANRAASPQETQFTGRFAQSEATL